MRRVLVTGSRFWKNKSAIYDALDEQWQISKGQMTVVHGACPTGADHLASAWCRDVRTAVQNDPGPWTLEEDPHPADWNIHGKAAGPLRNQEMVDLGADVCLAFPLPDSKGTVDCMKRVRKAKIPIIEP